MKKIFIIAEAGVNHNGDYDTALKLIDVAAAAGADCVKFQTFHAEKLVSAASRLAEYQVRNLDSPAVSQYEMLKQLELPEEWHSDLKSYTEQKGMQFLSTAFDPESIDFLDRLGIQRFKIPSGEITNLPYLERIASTKKPVILSTGMADMEEVRAAVHVLTTNGISKEQLTVLHCNTEYPTPMEDVNLNAMRRMADELGVATGYSDHTAGIEVAIAAAALGATVIEKHFTLDRSMPGPDHKASLEPGELKAMVSAIRNIEVALSGIGEKKPSASEIKNKVAARKSIHLKTSLPADHALTAADLEMKRPGDGISPMLLPAIMGKRLKHALPAEHKLELNELY